MKKVLLIGWKDLMLAFRDRAALVLMLLAPFALTLGMGFVTGHFSGSSGSGVGGIRVALVNQDGGQLGNALVSAFQSQELATLVVPTIMDDPVLARQSVDDDKVAAAVIIPHGFTDSIVPAQGRPPSSDVVQIVLYSNPTRPTSAGVIKTIVDEFVGQVEIGRVAGQVAVTQLIAHGLVKAQDAARVAGEVALRTANAARDSTAITLENVTSGAQAVSFDALAYMAPGMALMFLMFTVSNGGRTLLTERAQGTLPRLLVSPTSTVQVLGGKVLGIFMTGAAQMFILILASALLFGLSWGAGLPVLVLVLAAVAAAVGWGMLITALAKTSGQVSALGAAITLTFGMLGGTFINMDNMPAWFQVLSKVTPNAWGMDGFLTLALGGRLADIRSPVMALLAMGALLFIVAVLILNRRGIAQA